MKNYEIVSNETMCEMFREEEKSGRDYFDFGDRIEIDGLLYHTYVDTRNGKEYAVREIRTVHMGFNSNDEGKVEELIEIVEREGACNASWGVTGRTMHCVLAGQLAEQLPQYRSEIGYNYKCTFYKK